MYEDDRDCVAKNAFRPDTIRALVNQPDYSGETPLHCAVRMNSLEAAKGLLDHGAEIDAFNENLQTPLYYAVHYGHYEVARLLLERGAQREETTVPSRRLIQLACRQGHSKLANLLLEAGELITHVTESGENLLQLMTWNEPSDRHDMELFCRFLEHGVDLYMNDRFGISAFHHLFLEGNLIYLRATLDRYPKLDLESLAGWPDTYFGTNIRELISTSRNLRYVRSRLTQHEIQQLCGLAKAGGHSLLCRAACWGSVEAIKNIKKLGVDNIEHYCSEHGTPLEAAVLHRRLEATKHLVRNGALIPFELSRPKNSAISTRNPDFMIRQWLFVGRYTERKSLPRDNSGEKVKMKSWSGVWVAQIILPLWLRQGVGESTLDYAHRRKSILSCGVGNYLPLSRLAQLKRYKFEKNPADLCLGSEEMVNTCGD